MKFNNRFISNIEYLSKGNLKQKQAYRVLNEIKIFNILKEYNPILVGTIPIDIDIPESDLDIICEVNDFKTFKRVLIEHYQELNGFNCSIKKVDNNPRIVSSFQYKEWTIEVFGQTLPPHQQNGYKHMIIEDRILNILGTKGKEKIRKLKIEGLKTEPAFGQLLKINEKPYEYLLQMFEWEDNKLKEYLRAISFDVV